MTPRFLVLGLKWRSKWGEVRIATKAREKSKSFLISNREDWCSHNDPGRIQPPRGHPWCSPTARCEATHRLPMGTAILAWPSTAHPPAPSCSQSYSSAWPHGLQAESTAHPGVIPAENGENIHKTLNILVDKPQVVLKSEMIQCELLVWLHRWHTSQGTPWWVLPISGLIHSVRNQNYSCEERCFVSPSI